MCKVYSQLLIIQWDLFSYFRTHVTNVFDYSLTYWNSNWKKHMQWDKNKDHHRITLIQVNKAFEYCKSNCLVHSCMYCVCVLGAKFHNLYMILFSTFMLCNLFVFWEQYFTACIRNILILKCKFVYLSKELNQQIIWAKVCQYFHLKRSMDLV